MTYVTILAGHVSPDTAYVVDDYPYGFRLRCKMRYWLDVHLKRGVRLISQTTNPKIVGREVWNKPKASTYAKFGGAMYLNHEGHVHWAGLTEYSDAAETDRWIDTYGTGNVIPEVTAHWQAAKHAYERKDESPEAMLTYKKALLHLAQAYSLTPKPKDF